MRCRRLTQVSLNLSDYSYCKAVAVCGIFCCDFLLFGAEIFLKCRGAPRGDSGRFNLIEFTKNLFRLTITKFQETFDES